MKACIILHNMIIEDERVDDNELVAIASGNYDYDSLGIDGPVEVSQSLVSVGLVSVGLTLLFYLLYLAAFLPGGLFLGELTVALLYES